jgi:ribosomal protein L14
MIQKETKVYIRCNSGGKIGKVFHIFENNENLGLNIVLGNTVMLSLRKIVPNLKKLKKGDVSRGLVIGAHKKSIFAQSSMHSLKNSVILLQKGENLPLGTRVFTKVSKICRYKGFTRLASISKGFF